MRDYWTGLMIAEAPVFGWFAWRIYSIVRDFVRETRWFAREEEKRRRITPYR